eukprot:7195465-Pyramimonas_sp.AAC.1
MLKSFKGLWEIYAFCPWGRLGSPLGGLLGRFGNLVSRLEVTLATWTNTSAIQGSRRPSWGHLGALLPRLGAFLGLRTARGGV